MTFVKTLREMYQFSRYRVLINLVVQIDMSSTFVMEPHVKTFPTHVIRAIASQTTSRDEVCVTTVISHAPTELVTTHLEAPNCSLADVYIGKAAR